jgi:hypothetical protein
MKISFEINVKMRNHTILNSIVYLIPKNRCIGFITCAVKFNPKILVKVALRVAISVSTTLPFDEMH